MRWVWGGAQGSTWGRWSGAPPCGQVEKWEGSWTHGFGLWGAFGLDINVDGRPRVGPCHLFSGGGSLCVRGGLRALPSDTHNSPFLS